MLTRRRLLYLILIVAVLFGITVLVLSRQGTTSSPPASITYTDSITGRQTDDIIAEFTSLSPDEGVVDSTATIDGIDVIYDNLTNDQALNAHGMIRDFLLARSGLAAVYAGVVANSFTQSGSTVQFDVSVAKPQATYHVTIKTSSQVQTIPDVTFKRVE